VREKTLHILPPDERNMFAETLAIQFREPMAMTVFLDGHLREQFRCGREIRAERFGEVPIGVCVLFLGRDGEGEYLGFVQIAE